LKRLSPRLASVDALTFDSSDGRLPDDVVADQVRRLSVYAYARSGHNDVAGLVTTAAQ
jgi:hypothetical protein